MAISNALNFIAEHALSGAVVTTKRNKVIRRVLMPRAGLHLYYRAAPRGRTATVVSAWHAVAEKPPRFLPSCNHGRTEERQAPWSGDGNGDREMGTGTIPADRRCWLATNDVGRPLSPIPIYESRPSTGRARGERVLGRANFVPWHLASEGGTAC